MKTFLERFLPQRVFMQAQVRKIFEIVFSKLELVIFSMLIEIFVLKTFQRGKNKPSPLAVFFLSFF